MAPKSGKELQDDLKRELPRQLDDTKQNIALRMETHKRQKQAGRLASAKQRETEEHNEQFGI